MDPKPAIEKYMSTTTQCTDDLSLDKVVVSKLGLISSTYMKSITYGYKDKFAAAEKRYNESPEFIAWFKAYVGSLCEGGCKFARKMQLWW